jgi:hypothetical protein
LSCQQDNDTPEDRQMARYLDMNELRNFDVNGQTFDLLALVEALPRTLEGWTHPESVKDLKVGQIVHVWAMGDRLRRGVVIKLGRTKVSVAFTTQGAVDEAVRYRGGKDIRVADTAVQLSQINIPAAPVAEPEPEIEEPAEVAVETPAPLALTEAEIEENAAEVDRLSLEAAEAARTENEAPGGIYHGTIWASPTPSRFRSTQMVGRVLRRPKPELVRDLLPPLAAGKELVRIADLKPLTHNSHAGKVNPDSKDGPEGDEMTGTEETSAVIRELTGSAVVRLLERVHERICQNHPEVPGVVIVTGSGIGAAGNKWGHFRPQGWITRGEEGNSGNVHEMFIAGETLAKGAPQVLQTMLHESAHAVAEVRGEKDTSRQGRWHNKVFKKIAEELGLEYRRDQADKTLGYSQVVLTRETLAEYADLLVELDREICLMVRLPGWLGGTSDGDGGGHSIGTAPRTGGETSSASSGRLKLTCTCPEPNILQASRKVAAKMVVRCDECESLFEPRS